MQLFDPLSANAKVIVLFTDGKTTAGPPPAPVAAAARAEGIILYCIGLIGSDGLDVSVRNDWAPDPDASHVAVTPDAADLEDLFEFLCIRDEETESSTVSGWVMERLGRVPRSGESFRYEGWLLTAAKADPRRVCEVEVRRLPAEQTLAV